jgi:hypothetical protein
MVAMCHDMRNKGLWSRNIYRTLVLEVHGTYFIALTLWENSSTSLNNTQYQITHTQYLRICNEWAIEVRKWTLSPVNAIWPLIDVDGRGFIAPRPLYTGPLCPTCWNSFLPSSPPARETSINEGRKLKRIYPAARNSPQNLGFLTCPKVGT